MRLYSTNHIKPFTLALGIGFTIITLTIVGAALMNGGLDFRSRAAPVIKNTCMPRGECAGVGAVVSGVYCGGCSTPRQCCRTTTYAPSPTPLPQASPTPLPQASPTPLPQAIPTVSAYRMYYCRTDNHSCVQTSSYYSDITTCADNVINYIDRQSGIPTTQTCYATLASCQKACQ